MAGRRHGTAPFFRDSAGPWPDFWPPTNTVLGTRRARGLNCTSDPGPAPGWEDTMTDQERVQALTLLERIEVAIGEVPDRDGANAALITEVIQAVNGLRALLRLERPH